MLHNKEWISLFQSVAAAALCRPTLLIPAIVNSHNDWTEKLQFWRTCGSEKCK